MRIQLLDKPVTFDSSEVSPSVIVCSAQLHVDMLAYIEAHAAHANYVKEHRGEDLLDVRTESARLQDVFLNIRKEYTDDITGVSGSLIWLEFLAKAMNGLDSAQQQSIKDAPASSFFNDSFVELVKNCMDEIILGYHDVEQSSLETAVNLVMKIQYDEVNDLISIVLSDNGRGFPEDFLAKTNTSAARYTLITENRSPSTKLGMDVPDLFGGAGRGLTMLIAKVECHANLEKGGHLKLKENYARPNSSTIKFDNDPMGGAVISVITSISRSIIEKKIDTNSSSVSDDEPVLNFPPRKIAMNRIKQKLAEVKVIAEGFEIEDNDKENIMNKRQS